MKKTKLGTWGIFGLLLLSGGTTSAGAQDYCTPVIQLTSRISSCTDNEVLFGEAAVKCLEKFEKEVSLETIELQKRLVGGGASTASAAQQKGAYHGAEKNYLNTKTRLNSMIANGRRALEQIGEYRNNLALPEDFESARNMGFTVEEFLGSIPCYQENRKLLLEIGHDFLSKIEELEEARDVAAASEKSSSEAKLGIGESKESLAAPVNSKPGQGAGKVAGKAPKRSQSDITGTERKPANLPKK